MHSTARKQRISIPQMYLKLRRRFGFLDWWPGDTSDEVVIGAILTQNTSWKNVEKAINNMKEGNAVSMSKIARMNPRALETMIRPSGFYRQKAKRLKGFAVYVAKNYGSLGKFFSKDTMELRTELLNTNGIGPETADSIVLYAAEKPVFVIDAYTNRIMERVYGIDGLDYGELQSHISNAIKKDVMLYQDFHAQFVELAKNHCRKVPICANCPLEKVCSFNISQKSP